jgi:hypothetical protein
MARRLLPFLLALLATPWSARATTFDFLTDPFDGLDVRSIPGRQIVGGELFLSFDPAHDVFAFDPSVFGVASQIAFANGQTGSLPAGVDVVVVQALDDDDTPGTPFGASNAANLIADRVTTPGPASSSTSTRASTCRDSCSRPT